jgi:phosphatidylserine/phosphatidylglycerophosphate/cardiolipin synthase-like enzyme
LLKGGIRIYERQGLPLHAKTLVVDSVGLANLDYRSLVYNFELNTFVHSDQFGRAMDVPGRRGNHPGNLATSFLATTPGRIRQQLVKTPALIATVNHDTD